MHQDRVGRGAGFLWGMILAALVFVLALHYLHTLTGYRMLDSLVGVGLGLYICSHPAATTVDLLFFNRGAIRGITKAWAGLGWLGLNMLVFLAGWYVIFASVTHLVGKTL